MDSSNEPIEGSSSSGPSSAPSTSADTTPSFPFVMYNGPSTQDENTGRFVRQYVMRGATRGRRPAGRNVRPLDSRALAASSEETAGTIIRAPDDYQRRIPLQSKISLFQSSWLGAGRSDPFATFPIEMDSRSRELVEHLSNSIYASTKMLNVRNLYLWYPSDVTDPAAFHQLLSNTAVYRSIKRNQDLNTEDSLSHHNEAMKIVESRLADVNFSTSDDNISAIVSLCEYSVMTGGLEEWQLHMNALKEMIRLRGGHETLRSNERLCLQISWSDIIGSIKYDTAPNFPLLGHATVPAPQPRPPIPIAELWRSQYPTRFSMYECLTDLGEWTAIFLSAVQSTGESLFNSFPISRGWGSWDHSVTSLVHRILSIQEPVSFHDEGSVLHEACRLSSWLYLAEIRHKFYIRPVDYKVQKDKLHELLQRHGKPWERLEVLHFWVLVMAFLQTNEGAQRRWFAGEVRMVGERIGVGGRVEAEEELRRLLWIDDVHGYKLHELQSDIWP